MSLPNPNVQTKFIVEVANVKEVAVEGEADLVYWQERLRGLSLFPYQAGGKAQLMVGGTELFSMGKRTNELTVGLVVCERPAGDSPDGVFLVYAFNSSRLFAWIERAFFSTPYFWGRMGVQAKVPAHIHLADDAGTILNFQMNAASQPITTQEELWQGKIYLPRHSPTPQKFFVAKLAGQTEIYPVSLATNSFQITARQEHPVFQWLLDSHFAAKEWRIRQNATHARSKSFLVV